MPNPNYSSDSFTQNPLISSIGSALGLGPLFAEGGPAAAGAAGPPAAVKAAAAPKITPVKPPVPESRVAQTRESMAVRERYPQPRGSATRGVSPGVSGPGMNLPGVMDPAVLQHPEVQKLLNQYGVSPEQVQSTIQNATPNLFITNQSAYEKHPVLTGMLERGLEGAAFTKGSNTIGEGISNVAQGVLNGQAARADKYNNQLMMPFAEAQQVQALKAAAQEQALKEAQARYDQAHADYWDTMGDLRGQMLDWQKEKQKELNDITSQNHVLAFLNQHKDAPLNDKEQAAMNDLAQKYEGIEKAPLDQIQGIYNTAMQRALDTKNAEALKRANVAGSWHYRSSERAADQTANKLTNEDIKNQINNLEKRYAKFQAEYAATRSGHDLSGKFVSGSAAKAAGNDYVQQLKDLNAQLLSVPQQMKIPGTVQPQKKKLTYNAVTGKIE